MAQVDFPVSVIEKHVSLVHKGGKKLLQEGVKEKLNHKTHY